MQEVFRYMLLADEPVLPSTYLQYIMLVDGCLRPRQIRHLPLHTPACRSPGRRSPMHALAGVPDLHRHSALADMLAAEQALVLPDDVLSAEECQGFEAPVDLHPADLLTRVQSYDTAATGMSQGSGSIAGDVDIGENCPSLSQLIAELGGTEGSSLSPDCSNEALSNVQHRDSDNDAAEQHQQDQDQHAALAAAPVWSQQALAKSACRSQQRARPGRILIPANLLCPAAMPPKRLASPACTTKQRFPSADAEPLSWDLIATSPSNMHAHGIVNLLNAG